MKIIGTNKQKLELFFIPRDSPKKRVFQFIFTDGKTLFFDQKSQRLWSYLLKSPNCRSPPFAPWASDFAKASTGQDGGQAGCSKLDAGQWFPAAGTKRQKVSGFTYAEWGNKEQKNFYRGGTRNSTEKRDAWILF